MSAHAQPLTRDEEVYLINQAIASGKCHRITLEERLEYDRRRWEGFIGASSRPNGPDTTNHRYKFKPSKLKNGS